MAKATKTTKKTAKAAKATNTAKTKTRSDKSATKKSAAMTGAGWTGHAKTVNKAFDAFLAMLKVGDPLTKEERDRLKPAQRRTDEFIQGGVAIWEQHGQRTGLAHFDAAAALDGIRESAAMQSVLMAMTAGTKLFEERLFRVRNEGVLETDALVAALRESVKRTGNADLKPALKTLLDLKKKKNAPKRMRPTAAAKRAAKGAASATPAPTNGATTKTSEKTFEKVTETTPAKL